MVSREYEFVLRRRRSFGERGQNLERMEFVSLVYSRLDSESVRVYLSINAFVLHVQFSWLGNRVRSSSIAALGSQRAHGKT